MTRCKQNSSTTKLINSQLKTCWDKIYIPGKELICTIIVLSLFNLLAVNCKTINPPPADTGVSDAPLTPANTVIKTVCASGCNYSTIQAAVNASSAGWTIQVKNGTYNENVVFTNKNCTRAQPCTLQRYPGHNPKITQPSTTSHPISLNASWWIIDGFEIDPQMYGIKVWRPHNTIRNMWIHDTGRSAILLDGDVASGDILIEDNLLENCGVDDLAYIGSRGVYMSIHNYYQPLSNVTIRRNTVRNCKSGFGGNGQNATTAKISNFLIENNVIKNISHCFDFFFNFTNGTVRNNTCVNTATPTDPGNIQAMLFMTNDIQGLNIHNNIFYSTVSNLKGVHTEGNNTNNKVDNNLWLVTYQSWTWNNQAKTNFNGTYKSTTSWDSYGLVNVNPMLANISTQDYRLQSGSPARNAGMNSKCAAFDKNRKIRPQENICDIGMDEFAP